jgi:signal transduction histidine kinase/ActR/RegA family two-component response regulator
MEDTLRRAADVLARSGEDFFPAAVSAVAHTLSAGLVFIGELIDEAEVRTLAVVRQGELAANFTFPLEASALSNLVTSAAVLCPAGARERFPGDRNLQAAAGESFLAVRVNDAAGTFVGVVAAAMSHPLHEDHDGMALLQIFAGRVGAELQRARSERVLKEREDHLRQVQQVEAIGRLAGGIAHDFNNLLMIMSGYAEVLRDRHGPSREVIELMAAAARATALTRQLLAYGRRQVLHVERLNLNDVVRRVDGMLAPVISPRVRLETSLDAELPAVDADRHQFEQMLVNLALNARDAMPEGGTLTLSTRIEAVTQPYHQMPAGSYVCLEVADTGVGMTEDVKSHIFEPFYTTKGARGSGLGLSSVYGVVKQSNGFIWCHSEPGTGTTFTIYLQPAASAGRGAESLWAGAPGPALPGSAEAAAHHLVAAPTDTRPCCGILVVEDEVSVRKWVSRILRAGGYDVTDVEDGASALEVMRDPEKRPSLVVTDIVMPGVNGTRLAEDIERQWPDTRLLFVSGFANSASVRATGVVARKPVLGKPFTPDQVLRAVRDALAQPPADSHVA